MVNGGGGGGELVMVTLSPAERALVLPAVSRVRDVNRNVPFGNADAVIVHWPCALVLPVPKMVLLASRSISVLAGPVPLKVGVLSVVMLSVLETPVSGAGSRSGMPDGGGAWVWMTTCNAPDGALVLFPILARAVKQSAPSTSGGRESTVRWTRSMAGPVQRSGV